MTRKDFTFIAQALVNAPITHEARNAIVDTFIVGFRNDNTKLSGNFDVEKFINFIFYQDTPVTYEPVGYKRPE